MRSKLTSLWDEIREDFGHPMTLKRRLLAQPPRFRVQPRASVSLEDIIRWNEWLDAVARDGSPSNYHAFRRYAPLTETRVIENFSCSIRDVEGLGASKAPIEEYTDLDELAVHKTSFTSEISDAQLARMLAWNGYHGAPRIDLYNFAQYLWDGRIFWRNDDGSHHFMAARYIASKLGVRVALKPRRLTIFSLHEGNLRALLADWHVFALEDFFSGGNVHYEHYEPIVRLFERGYRPPRDLPSIRQCLKATEAPHEWVTLPRPYTGDITHGRASTASAQPGRPFDHGKTAVFLPQRSARASRAAHALRAAGVFDLGAYLMTLCAQQRAVLERAPAHAGTSAAPVRELAARVLP